jgi:hypothetical protein
MASRRVGRAIIAAACAFVSIAIAPSAFAAPGPAHVRVNFAAACTPSPIDRDAFLRVLDVELRTDGVDIDPAGANDATLATIGLSIDPCTETARAIDITIDDFATAKSVRRTFDFGDIAHEARPRALALAVVELLHASWAELSLPNAKPAIAIPESIKHVVVLQAPIAIAPPSPPESESRAALRIDASLAYRSFPSYDSDVLGGRLAFAFAPASSVVRFELDANAFGGTSFDPLVVLHTNLASFGAAVLFARDVGAFEFGVGPRAEVGYAWAHWTVNNVEASGSGTLFDLAAMLRLRALLGNNVSASFSAEIGDALHNFTLNVDGKRASGFGGVMLGSTIGIARSF